MSKPLNFTITDIDNQWKLLTTNGGNYKVRTFFNTDPDDDGVTVHDENDNFICELSGYSLETQLDCESDFDCETNMLELISAIETIHNS